MDLTFQGQTLDIPDDVGPNELFERLQRAGLLPQTRGGLGPRSLWPATEGDYVFKVYGSTLHVLTLGMAPVIVRGAPLCFELAEIPGSASGKSSQ